MNWIGGAVQVPLCSKVAADQEAGKFATKSPHHNSLLILQKWHFLKVLTFTKDFTDNTECNKHHCQLVASFKL